MTDSVEERGDICAPDPNSALLWFPPVAQAGLPVPRTEFVRYEPVSLCLCSMVSR